ncbi:MAG: bacillithiol biosynthesis cysteine-adding enzyme BshC [Deinococcales bacterium]
MNPLEAFRSGQLLHLHRLQSGDFTSALETRRNIARPALVQALLEYALHLAAPKAVLENIKKLESEDAVTVMTGQQAGLLLGPAYSIYKAIDAILLAQKLSTPERPVLPVFWIASQDHDAQEVRHAYLLDLSEKAHTISLELPKGVPIGAISLEPSYLETVLHHLEKFDAPTHFKNPMLEVLRKTFAQSKTYAEWFARMLHHLLGQYGLIIVDPMFPPVAALFTEGIKRELETPLVSSASIEAAAHALEHAGFTPQLRRTPNASNLFLTGEDGQRRLLKSDGTTFYAEREYTRQELEAILHSNPTRLTPAAGLRSILADMVFPSAINVLGPGELAYHLQLLGVYQLHNVPQPLMSPRMNVVILEPPIKRILQKYSLSAYGFIAGDGKKLEAQLFETHAAKERIEETLQNMMQQMRRLSSDLVLLEPGFTKNVERARRAVCFQLEHKLPHKLGAALARADKDLQQHLERLNKHLLPQGTPQERHNSFLEYMLKFGDVPLKRLFQLEPSQRHELEL